MRRFVYWTMECFKEGHMSMNDDPSRELQSFPWTFREWNDGSLKKWRITCVQCAEETPLSVNDCADSFHKHHLHITGVIATSPVRAWPRFKHYPHAQSHYRRSWDTWREAGSSVMALVYWEISLPSWYSSTSQTLGWVRWCSRGLHREIKGVFTVIASSHRHVCLQIGN